MANRRGKPMALYLLDNSLKVEVYYDPSDSEFDDNICISFVEDCPEEEKIFWAGETNIYLTAEQACALAEALRAATRESQQGCTGEGQA
jgi:hypothetical protein